MTEPRVSDDDIAMLLWVDPNHRMALDLCDARALVLQYREERDEARKSSEDLYLRMQTAEKAYDSLYNQLRETRVERDEWLRERANRIKQLEEQVAQLQAALLEEEAKGGMD